MIKRILLDDPIKTANVVAIIFHIIGLVGILFFNSQMVIQLTALNLLLMVGLIFFTHKEKQKSFYTFFIIAFLTGIGVEIIGVNTGLLFGDYEYGWVMGPKIFGVPYIIGMNWFMVMYGVGNCTSRMYNKISSNIDSEKKSWKIWGSIIDGAIIAVFFDWLMEPVAIKLEFWKWGGSGNIPLFNYLSWFAVSAFLLFIFRKLNQEKFNPFAMNLLLIQGMFFLILRTFL